MTILLCLAGIAGLFLGGNLLVSGAEGVARRLGLSPFVIGLTVVGFGTSVPELAVSVLAALDDRPAIAIGNVVGSNIANILLILGLTAVVAPIAVPAGVRRDLGWMLAAAVLCLPVFTGGLVGRAEGLGLCAVLAVYLWTTLRRDGDDDAPAVGDAPIGLAMLKLTAGVVAVVAGAQALVWGASELARALGVGEAAIGLTVVAVGTSLPELATSIVAAWSGRRDIALGNVIGSNIFNILGILGLTAVIAPIPVEPRFLTLDVPVMLAASLALALVLATRNLRGRLAGLAAVGLYASYVVGTGSA